MPTGSQKDRQATRSHKGRYSDYEICGHCGKTITAKTGWFHLADEPTWGQIAQSQGKDPKALVCGPCADLCNPLKQST